MKKTVIALLVIVFLSAGCNSPKAQAPNASPAQAASAQAASAAEYHSLSPEEAYKRMQELKNYIILDVRTEAEYKQIRIKGAMLIPVNEIADRAAKELTDKDQVIFVYCRSGGRSRGASMELVRQGYTNIYDIGGIMNWPYETVSN